MYIMSVVYNRKVELYEMSWVLRDGLRDSLVAAAPYGGPIAVMKESQCLSPSVRPQLDIYTASGVTMATFPWKSGPVVQLGWSVSEELLCVQQDGTVLIYDLTGAFLRHFSMGQEVVQSHVSEAKIFHSPYGTGVAIVTGSSRFTLATNIDDLKLRRLPEVPGLQGAPSCWAVLNQDRQTKVLLANGPELYLLDNTCCTSVVLPGGSPLDGVFVHIAVSFSYKYLALFTDTGHLWTGLANLQDKLSEVDTKIRSPPKQMVWYVVTCRPVCLPTCLSVHLPVCLPTCLYPLDEACVCVGELDGVRLLSPSRHELLQEVPLVCEDIFKIASMGPGALLLEAHKEYQKSSQKADEYLREIKEQGMLGDAVRQCVEAAGHEQHTHTQKALLRAASFGKCFLTNLSPEAFVSVCRDLRVLNAVRDPSIGIPLTHTQLYPLAIEVCVCVCRLVYRRLYPLAIEVCRYLKTPEYQGVSRILRHWACSKVQQKGESDEVMVRCISGRLADSPGISYSHIASKAYDSGRTELAIKLLDYEARSGEQVPLLLKMRRSQLALSKAIESGDTDLVYTVVSYVKNEMNRGDFFMTLRNQPVALSLYRQFCKLQEQETLKDLYNQDDDHQELANYYVSASYREKVQANCYVSASYREKVQANYYVSASYREKVQANYYVSASYRERYWWLKLKSLAEKEEWEELEKFSKSKKSPVGYLPFVEVCMKKSNKYEAKKYVTKVTPEQRVRAHLTIEDVEGAADAAIERRSEAEIGTVISHCSSSSSSSQRLLLDKLQRALTTANRK
uniref:Vacuolar protein sorting-associated protein 16 homolog n=1 Tax=Gadus morhua TaxID=8049 RepID=A0A8C5FJZ4_GADMO